MDDPLLKANGDEEVEDHGHVHGSGTENWRVARQGLHTGIIIKKTLLESLGRNTESMSKKTKREHDDFIKMTMTMIVFFGATTSMTKSALFHMSAVGMWDDGHAYKFSYPLSLTLLVFLLKMCLGFVQFCIRDDPEEEDKTSMSACSVDSIDRASFKEMLMPWVLLFVFTAFEMLSGTIASMGLLFGTPTTVFVIFKSSKVVFLAIMSVLILKRHLSAAQWASLLLISFAVGLATLAEGKGKKGGGYSLMGPALLLVSEFFHATFLVLQEVSVRRYWSNPLALLCASAALGALMTLSAIHAASNVWVTLPDGGHRPMSDFADTLYMCFHSRALGITMALHLIVHVSSDVMHIIILQHVSALARTLCDAVKLILMWLMGKLFWICGVLPFLAEAWHPGFIGSWLMLPAFFAVVYGLLMFKKRTFTPFIVVRDEGQIVVTTCKEPTPKNPTVEVKVSPDDPFYVQMFRSSKIKKKMMRRQGSDPVGRVMRRFTTRPNVPNVAETGFIGPQGTI